MKTVTDSHQLSSIKLSGFKSIKQCDVEMGRINILIGCNGAGKSNFIGFFRMIKDILDQQLQLYVSKQGGPDALLHFGRKTTESITTELYFGANGYKFSLEPTNDNRMVFARECLWWEVRGDWKPKGGHFESTISESPGRIKTYVIPAMKSWRIYHFHDTGEKSPIKKVHSINDNVYLRTDGENLAAFLYFLREKYSKNYKQIVKTIQAVAPFFGDFNLRPDPHNDDMIELEWMEKNSDVPFKAHLLSDGTLRFIGLATVLLQPKELQPDTILVDEPELGLHPFAIKTLAGLFKSAAISKQVIVSTQSVELLDEFDAEDVIVVDRHQNQSVLKRLKEEELTEWLEDYGIGELWKKNLIGGRPGR